MGSNAAADLLAQRKALHAVKLRARGLSLDAIAAARLPCPYHAARGNGDGVDTCSDCLPMYAHRSSAMRAIERQLEQEYAAGQETREQLRRHQLLQIDTLMQTAMPAAMGGDWEAARTCVRLLDRRARLLGLDAPARVQVTTELDQQIDALLQELSAQDQERTDA